MNAESRESMDLGSDARPFGGLNDDRFRDATTPASLDRDIYDFLRHLAATKLAEQSAGQTLDATALVHEVWIKLDKAEFEAVDRSHYLRTAAAAMRQILVDRARAKGTIKRNAGRRVPLPDVGEAMADEVVLDVDVALSQLAIDHPDHAKLIELRFFGGLTTEEAAKVLAVSMSKADRMWRFARAWLEVELDDGS